MDDFDKPTKLLMCFNTEVEVCHTASYSSLSFIARL